MTDNIVGVDKVDTISRSFSCAPFAAALPALALAPPALALAPPARAPPHAAAAAPPPLYGRIYIGIAHV